MGLNKALVLRKIAYGESDLIIHFLLHTGERFSGFAAGGRRSRKRFPHQFHPGGIYDLHFSRRPLRGRLSRIQCCDLIRFVGSVTKDIQSYSRWMTLLEWIEVEEGSLISFEEVLAVMESLHEPQGIFKYHGFFINRMKEHGVLPNLDHCGACGKPLKEPLRFSFEEGGFCHAHCSSGLLVSGFTLKFFQTLSEKGGDPREMDRICVPFLEHQLGRNLKTYSFFVQLAHKVHPHDPAPPPTFAG